MKTRFAVCAVATLLTSSPVAFAADDFEQAMRFYDHGKYSLALPPLHAAARSGDARAQEILGFMYALGGSLYPGVAHDRKAAQYWFDLAARNGRPVSRYMECALQRRSERTVVPVRLSCFDWIAETGTPAPK